MNDKKFATCQKAFTSGIKGIIGANKDRGWGADDSAQVIEDVIAADAEGASAGKYTISDEAMVFIKRVINPSAFRQVLEGLGWLNKAPEGARRGGKAEIAKLFA